MCVGESCRKAAKSVLLFLSLRINSGRAHLWSFGCCWRGWERVSEQTIERVCVHFNSRPAGVPGQSAEFIATELTHLAWNETPASAYTHTHSRNTLIASSKSSQWIAFGRARHKRTSEKCAIYIAKVLTPQAAQCTHRSNSCRSQNLYIPGWWDNDLFLYKRLCIQKLTNNNRARYVRQNEYSNLTKETCA